MASKRKAREVKPRTDVAGRVVTRLRARIDAVKADRDGNAAKIAAVQATTNVAQLRGEVVDLRREVQRLRAVVADHDRLLMLSLGVDDGAGGDDPNS